MQGIITGRKPVMEALRAGTNIEKIVFLLGVQGTVIEDIRHAAERNNVPVSQASRQEFRELASDATTQGVVAIVRQSKTFVSLDEIVGAAEAKKEKPLILILDSIEDPQNLGALVRTAECAGVHGVVIPKHHAASVTSAVVKASAGATEHMAMAEVTNIVSTMDELKGRGFWTAGVAVEGDTPFTGFDYTTAARTDTDVRQPRLAQRIGRRGARHVRGGAPEAQVIAVGVRLVFPLQAVLLHLVVQVAPLDVENLGGPADVPGACLELFTDKGGLGPVLEFLKSPPRVQKVIPRAPAPPSLSRLEV